MPDSSTAATEADRALAWDGLPATVAAPVVIHATRAADLVSQPPASQVA